MSAIWNGTEATRCVIQFGADVDAKDHRGKPMLFWAIIDDNAVELVRLLVEAGADVNATDDRGQSMLFWAILKENLEVIQILVDAGATH